jgi:phosphate transport system substrate-binding protein
MDGESIGQGKVRNKRNSSLNLKLNVLYVLVFLLQICMLTACGSRNSTAYVFAGSTSVQPYLEVLAEEYAHIRPEIEIDVQGGGSSTGITAVESGAADVGMSSRNLKESEQHLWSIEIAKDGLAVIVNPRNPVRNLTIEQIRGIYSAEITSWSQLGGAGAKIHIIAREEGSGTRSAFEEMVMGEERISPRAIIQDSNGAVRQLVADDRNSIGFISLGLVNIGKSPVKALQIDGAEASRDNIINGSYKLFRPFLLVAKSEPVGSVIQFIDYIRSPDGQRILSDEGLIPE